MCLLTGLEDGDGFLYIVLLLVDTAQVEVGLDGVVVAVLHRR